MAEREIRVRLSGNAREFQRTMRDAQGSVDTFARQAQRAGRRAAIAFGAVAAAGAALAKSVVDVGSETEQARIRLDSLFGSASEGQAAFEALRSTAAKLPFTFQEVLQAGTGLSVAVDSAAEMERRMQQVAEISARFGIGLQEAAAQFVRFSTAGAASADLFRERGVNAMLGIQAGAKTSAEESLRLWEQFFERIEAEGSSATAQLATSFSGIVSMLQDRWRDFRQMVSDAGFFDAVKSAMNDIMDQMDELAASGALEELAQRVSDAMTAALRAVGRFMVAAGNAVDTLLQNRAIAQFGLVGLLFFGAKGAAAGAALGAKFSQIIDAFNRALEAFASRDLKAIDRAMRDLVDSFDPLVTRLPEAAKEGSVLGDALRTVGKAMAEFEVDVQEAAEALAGDGGPGGLAGGAEMSAEELKKFKKELADLIPSQLSTRVSRFTSDLEAWAAALRDAADASGDRQLGRIAEGFQAARDSIREGAQFIDELAEGTGKVVQVLEDGRVVLLSNEEATRRWRDAADDVKDSFSEIVREIERALRGILDLGGALGFLSDRLSRVFTSLVNLGSNVADIVKAIGSGGGIGALAGPIGGALSAVGSIVAGAFGETARATELKALNAAIRELARDADKARRALEQLGPELRDELERALVAAGDVFAQAVGGSGLDALRRAGDAFKKISAGMEKDAARALIRMVGGVQGLVEISRALGIELDDLIKFAETGKAKGDELNNELRALGEILGLLPDSVEDVISAMDRLRNAFEETFNDFERFGIDDPLEKFRLLLKDLREIARAPQDAREEVLFPGEKIETRFGDISIPPIIGQVPAVEAGPLFELIQELQGLNLGASLGRNTAIGLINEFIDLIRQPGIQVPLLKTIEAEQDLEDRLISLIRLLRDVGEGTEGVRRGGGRLARPDEAPGVEPFIERVSFTEVQANELLSINRTIAFHTERGADGVFALAGALEEVGFTGLVQRVSQALGDDFQQAGGV